MTVPYASDIARVCFTCVLLLGLVFLFSSWTDTPRPIDVIKQPTVIGAHGLGEGFTPADNIMPKPPSSPGPATSITPEPDAVPAPKLNPLPRSELAYKLVVVKVYPHDAGSFTQGLIYLGNDVLYESSGLYGKTTVRKVDLKTGGVLKLTNTLRSDFGEGLAYYKGFFWQLLWKTRKVYKYDPLTLAKVGEYQSPSSLDFTDGWGLASSSDGLSRLHDPNNIPPGEELYLTDSGVKIYKIRESGGSLVVVSQAVITTPSGRPLEMANELELMGDGEMWANVFGKDCIARLDPNTGKIFGWIIGGEELRSTGVGSSADVFNGIAYDKEGGRIFVTGKLWSKMFEVRLEPVSMAASSLEANCVPMFNIFH